jgi:hypothetical protein
MTPQDLLKLHDETSAKCRGIMERKNSDYTGGKTATDALANFKASSALGLHPVMGLLLRLQDKLMRIRSFVADGELRVDGETVEDAFDDGINYLILGKALLREERSERIRLAVNEEDITFNEMAFKEPTATGFGNPESRNDPHGVFVEPVLPAEEKQAGNKPMTIEELFLIATKGWQAAAEQTKKEFGLDCIGNVHSFPTPKFGRDPSMGEPITEFKGFPEPEAVDPHAELKAQYESDCKVYAEPWRGWQWRYKTPPGRNENAWVKCSHEPEWDDKEYRRIGNP